MNPQSVEISPCRLSGTPGHAPIDDAEVEMWMEWRTELTNADPTGGDALDHLDIKMPEANLPRDMAIAGVKDSCHGVRKVKVKEINGLYVLGCFQRWLMHRSHDIIDARWDFIWKMIEGNAGVGCRLIVRGC